MVSTHSRLKAAGHPKDFDRPLQNGFNTQPPEGGWVIAVLYKWRVMRFNTQPPEGGWKAFWVSAFSNSCFNTQPPEGGWNKGMIAASKMLVSTHSRLKAAGPPFVAVFLRLKFQHTAA